MTTPTWAGRSATPPAPPQEENRAGWVPIAGLVAALGLVGIGAYILGTTGGDEAEAATLPPTTTAEPVETTLDEESASSSTTPTSEAASTATTESTATTDSTATTEASAANGEVDASGEDETEKHVVVEDGETRGAVLRDGVLYLGGEVPSREVADQIIERAAAVVGAENIVDEYVVNPDVAVEHGAPLYIEDVVLFAWGESTFDPQFEPLLDLGLLLLEQNPSVTVTIVTHTDASGSASFNDQLSFARGQSVAQYWVDRGIPFEQIVIDARGEREPRADNHTDEGAQLNRRAEFYIDGLLS